MWLNQLKIAVVQKDIDLLNSLLDNIPILEDPQEIENANYLLAEATKLVASLQVKTSKSMVQVKKNILFLKSTTAPNVSKLDIKS